MLFSKLFKATILLATFALASCGSLSSSLSSSELPSSNSVSSSQISSSNPSSSSSTTSVSSSIIGTSTSSGTSILSSDDPSSSSWPSQPLSDITVLDFYNFNDFHGAVEYAPSANPAEPGFNRLATYVDQKRTQNPDGFILTSSGDMWQGSADSNITRGRLVTDAMNLMGFDAMAIGNHEFDWGVDVIRENRELADYPFLGANIIHKQSGQRADFADAYTMIERQGVRIGIIGTMGIGLESVILTSIISDYSFNQIDSYVASAASELEAQGAHITILLNHGANVSSTALNYVDLVFNGHTHSNSASIINNTPNIQARFNGVASGYARLQYNAITDTVTTLDYGVEDKLGYLDLSDDEAMTILYADYYEREIREIKEEVIGTARYYFSREAIGRLSVLEMLRFGASYGAVAAIHNTGGIRSTINAGSVTFGDVYKALPFDNDLIVLELTGSQLKTWLGRSIYVAGVGKTDYIFEHNGQTISDSATYKIISISYITEDIKDFPHDVASEVNTFSYVRDLVANRWRTSGLLDPYNL